MALSPGTTLGPYEVVSSLGAGGMGEVYRARDTRLDRTVALKVLPAAIQQDPERQARFEREAKAISQLTHPNICTLYDLGRDVPTEQAEGGAGPSPRSARSGQAGGGEGTRGALRLAPLAQGRREEAEAGEATAPDRRPVDYLVMELVEGETLAQRLEGGPLALAQALELGAQIADALDAAHRHGIIHRDLKPGNVMLTSGGAGRSGVTTAKLLDFGLAKLTAHGERPVFEGSASAPTVAPATAEGTILGTLPYMAPEQLEGRPADARTDLWALGAMLYEMPAGRRAFAGESQLSLIGSIMNAEPPALSASQPLTPPALDRVVRKCLAKHPDGRWDSARDVADELRWIAQTPVAEADRSWRVGPRLLAAALAGALLMAAVGAGLTWVLRPAIPAVRVHTSLDVRPADEVNARGVAPPEDVYTPGGSRTAFAWTPDGQALVFVGRRSGVQQLYVRRLGDEEARPLAGTEGAQVPAVSHDGQWVAFWSARTIRKAPIAGGPVTDLAPGIAIPPFGLAWDESGRLFFGHPDGRIWQIPPGAAPEAVTTVGEREVRHVLPSPLPGGRTLLYTVRKREWSWGDEAIVAYTLATGKRKPLLQNAADARYLPSGHLVFLRRGTLFAVRFDVKRLAVQGEPIAVLDNLVQALTGGNSNDVTGAGQFAVAPTGALAWIRGPVVPYPEAVLATVDRRGQATPLPGEPPSYPGPLRLSPDGRRLAVLVKDLTESGLWLYDLAREALTPLARGEEAFWPIWSPDGGRLAFSWRKDGRGSLAVQPADGTSVPQPLLADRFSPSSWSPDGRYLAGVRDGDIVVVTVGSDQPDVRPLGKTPYIEGWPEFSPDGRWLANGSDKSGRSEVYVQPYPGLGAAVLVSVNGGSSPAWNPRGGGELFFVGPRDAAGKRSMLAVEISGGRPIGQPKPLFPFDASSLSFYCSPVRCYDVSADGQRFYVVQRRPDPPRPPVTHIDLILNWVDEVKAKVGK